MLKTIEVNPKSPPQASVIWLHGLGADGYDFAGIVPELNLPAKYAVRFVFPHAPMRPVKYAGNIRMRAWFDLDRLDIEAKEDKAGICHSQQLINELIENEIKQGIPSNKIVLAGFSQGGAMSLQCGLRFPQKLAGILVLSAWLPLVKELTQERNSVNDATPILMIHGTEDPLLPLDWAKKSYDYLKEMGYQIKFSTYNMPHSVCPEEIVEIGKWLTTVLE